MEERQQEEEVHQQQRARQKEEVFQFHGKVCKESGSCQKMAEQSS